MSTKKTATAPKVVKDTGNVTALDKARAARVPVPKDETDAQRFKRLAPKRLANALAAIGKLGNLAGSGYEYSPEAAKYCVSQMVDAVKAVNDKFMGTKAKKATDIVIPE